MKTTNLRNKPLDRRRLSAEDKAQYQPRQKAKSVAQARRRRGQLAWENKVDRGRQEQKPGTGGISGGRYTQPQRLREKGQELARSRALRGS